MTSTTAFASEVRASSRFDMLAAEERRGRSRGRSTMFSAIEISATSRDAQPQSVAGQAIVARRIDGSTCRRDRRRICGFSRQKHRSPPAVGHTDCQSARSPACGGAESRSASAWRLRSRPLRRRARSRSFRELTPLRLPDCRRRHEGARSKADAWQVRCSRRRMRSAVRPRRAVAATICLDRQHRRANGASAQPILGAARLEAGSTLMDAPRRAGPALVCASIGLQTVRLSSHADRLHR